MESPNSGCRRVIQRNVCVPWMRLRLSYDYNLKSERVSLGLPLGCNVPLARNLEHCSESVQSKADRHNPLASNGSLKCRDRFGGKKGVQHLVLIC
jgi:hypothetical protein